MYEKLSDFILSFFNIEDDDEWSELDLNIRIIAHLIITYLVLIIIGIVFNCLYEIILCSTIFNIFKQLNNTMWDSNSLERCTLISTVLFLVIALIAKSMSVYFIKAISCFLSTIILIVFTINKHGKKFLNKIDKMLEDFPSLW